MSETPECSYKKENLICIRCIDFLPDDADSNFVVEVFFFSLKYTLQVLYVLMM